MKSKWQNEMTPDFVPGDTVVSFHNNKTIKGFVHYVHQRKHAGYKRKPDKYYFYYSIREKPKLLFIMELLEGLEADEYIYDSNSPTRDGFYRKVKSCRVLLTEKINIVNK